MLDILTEYIAWNGLDSLAELGIKIARHPSLPLLSLKYSQIDSPKYHPIVRLCRGTVIEDETYKIVARPFKRFYNVDEEPNSKFVWGDDIACIEKVDGSLIIVYFYNGKWQSNPHCGPIAPQGERAPQQV